MPSHQTIILPVLYALNMSLTLNATAASNTCKSSIEASRCYAELNEALALISKEALDHEENRPVALKMPLSKHNGENADKNSLEAVPAAAFFSLLGSLTGLFLLFKRSRS